MASLGRRRTAEDLPVVALNLRAKRWIRVHSRELRQVQTSLHLRAQVRAQTSKVIFADVVIDARDALEGPSEGLGLLEVVVAVLVPVELLEDRPTRILRGLDATGGSAKALRFGLLACLAAALGALLFPLPLLSRLLPLLRAAATAITATAATLVGL